MQAHFSLFTLNFTLVSGLNLPRLSISQISLAAYVPVPRNFQILDLGKKPLRKYISKLNCTSMSVYVAKIYVAFKLRNPKKVGWMFKEAK